MTNPRLPKPLIHSPPTPPPAKQIHISHKTPSLSTTPRISITTRTSDAAEPPVPVSSPSGTNTQVTLNTTTATPTATALPTQTHHMDRVVPNFNTTRTIQTAHTASTTSIHKPSSNNERNLIILQVNINDINNKLEELKTLIKNTHADIITIQETKLTSKSNTPKAPIYTTFRADRPHKSQVTLIRDNITFTPTDIPSTINTHNIKLQMVKVHLNNTKHITIANVYIPPRDSTSTHYKTAYTSVHLCTVHLNTCTPVQACTSLHLYTCTPIHLYMHMHLYTYTFVHLYTHTLLHYTCGHLNICTSVQLYNPVHRYTCALIHPYIGTPIHMYTHTFIHLYTHTFIHLYTHTFVHLYTCTPIHLYTIILVHPYICAPISTCTPI